jgi:hypothetical protein
MSSRIVENFAIGGERMREKRVVGLLLAAVLLVSNGCVQTTPVKRIKRVTKKRRSYSRMMGYSYKRERDYSLAPEPYSLASDEKDPELLGPQTTLREHPLKESKEELSSSPKSNDNKPEVESSIPAQSADNTPKAEVVSELYDDNGDTKKKKAKKSSSMSRSECIGIIGLAKFNQYSKKYGGEGAAIRRCIILKRLGG